MKVFILFIEVFVLTVMKMKYLKLIKPIGMTLCLWAAMLKTFSSILGKEKYDVMCVQFYSVTYLIFFSCRIYLM